MISNVGQRRPRNRTELEELTSSNGRRKSLFSLLCTLRNGESDVHMGRKGTQGSLVFFSAGRVDRGSRRGLEVRQCKEVV